MTFMYGSAHVCNTAWKSREGQAATAGIQPAQTFAWITCPGFFKAALSSGGPTVPYWPQGWWEHLLHDEVPTPSPLSP